MMVLLRVNPTSYDKINKFLKLVNSRQMNVRFTNGCLEFEQAYLEEILRLADINKIKLMN